MVDPGLSELGKGIRIAVRDVVILEDELAGSQMPPDIRIGHAAGRHDEQDPAPE